MEKETIVVKVGRCSILTSTFGYRGCILALSSKGRFFVIPSCNIAKNLTISTFVPFVGHYKTIKEIKEQDTLLETLSIEQCEKLAERIITKEEIREGKIESRWTVKYYVLLLNTDEKLEFGTLDVENMKKLLSNL